MITEIALTLASSLIALTWVRILPFIYYIKYYLSKESFKPFDCVFCLSGWITLIVTFINGSSYLGIFLATVYAPFIGMLVEHLFDLYIKHKMQ